MQLLPHKGLKSFPAMNTSVGDRTMITTSPPVQHEKAKPAGKPESVYIHIPFCTHKCEFCDFAAFAGLSHMEDEYTGVVCLEMARRLDLPQKPKIKTVFFGGGTPGLMSADNLQKIFQSLLSLVDLDQDAEVSLETTPHAISPEKAARWRALGINRLSIGIESLLDEELTAIGRDHSVGEALKGIELAADSGIKELCLDFMYGLPTQTLKALKIHWIEPLL